MSYSVEFNDASTDIRVLDPTGDDMDLEVFIEDEVVYLRQVNPQSLTADLIAITPCMLQDLIDSYSKPEGFYR